MLSKKANRFIARYLRLTRFQIRRELERFSAAIGESDRTLDIGSGTDKPYADLFRSGGWFGIDLYEPSDIRGDISSLPIASESADLVICTEVLEHIPEPGQVLQEARRVLRTGRYLILTVPLLWGEHDHVDYQRWTRAGLKRLLDQNRLDILTIEPRGGLFSAIGCLISQIPLQVFGRYDEIGNWFLRLVYVAAAVLVLPVPWLCSLLDFLDRRRHFAVGYCVLCRKSP